MTDRHDDWKADEVRAVTLDQLDERFARYRLAQAKQEQHMAKSLEHYGQISPIVVCLHEGDYVVIDGFKRLRAARTLKGVSTLQSRRMDLDEQAGESRYLSAQSLVFAARRTRRSLDRPRAGARRWAFAGRSE